MSSTAQRRRRGVPVARPVLTKLGISGKFRAASTGGTLVSRLPRSRGKHAIGGAISFMLNVAARVSFSIQQVRSGVVKHGRCAVSRGAADVAGAAAARKRCTRLVTLRGAFSTSGRAGGNQVLFSGRLRGRALPAGSYRLTGAPAGGRAMSAAFNIVRC